VSFGTLLAAALVSASGSIQGEEICLTSARIWVGSGDDVRHIRDQPVPDSYRTGLTTGGCNTLIREQLIEWHLAFGDEASTTAALAFFEEAYAPVLAAPEAYAGLMRQALAEAAPELRAA
jgi:hypothetical protein